MSEIPNKPIDILIVVDCENALSTGPTGGLGNNLYMFDTNHHVGTCTTCENGKTLNWRILPLCPDNSLVITAFAGPAVTKKIIAPQKSQDANGDYYWEAVVNSQKQSGNFQYTISISIDNSTLTFAPSLKVVTKKPE